MKTVLRNYMIALFMVGTMYSVQVKAGCDAPIGTTIVDIGTTTVRFEWLPVPDASYYLIQYHKTGTTSWQTMTSQLPEFETNDLTAGTTYEWQVQTGCQLGLSAVTKYDRFTTLSHPLSVPTGLTHSNTRSSITLSWNTVSGSCGYNLQWKQVSSVNWTTVSGISATSFSLSGLASCTDYQFRIKTSCNFSSSLFSPTITFTTPGCNVENYSTMAGSGKMMQKSHENSIQFEMFPNPVRDHLQIAFTSPGTGEVTATIFNIIGNKLTSEKSFVNEGTNSINLNTSQLSEGIYLLELENNGDLTRGKFMIRK